MRLISILFTTIKLFVALCLSITLTLGYSTLATTALLHAHYGGCLNLKAAIMLLLLLSGLYFSVQVSCTLLTRKTLPLSSRGHELYAQQRASTLWLCGMIGWYYLLSHYLVATKQIIILSILLGYAQLQLAQSLSGGKVCDLLPYDSHGSFSLWQFINDKILRYADKKYLNAQITCGILFLILPLELLSESTVEQGPVALSQYFLWSFANQAQYAISAGIIIPCACYIWNSHPFFIRLRELCHWLAPSLLFIFQGLSLITVWQHGAIEQPEVAIANAAALIFMVFAGPITQSLMYPARENAQPLEKSAQIFGDLKEEAHLLF